MTTGLLKVVPMDALSEHWLVGLSGEPRADSWEWTTERPSGNWRVY